jgi:hypothetical protein
MGEKLLILKCKRNHICYKSLSSGILKARTSDPKKLNIMIQIQNEKKIFKKIKILANLSTMNHFWFMVLARHGLHLLWSGLGGFKIPIVGIPRELSLCKTNHIHLNCFANIIILLNSWKCITWETPPPTWVCQWCVIIC